MSVLVDFGSMRTSFRMSKRQLPDVFDEVQ